MIDNFGMPLIPTSSYTLMKNNEHRASSSWSFVEENGSNLSFATNEPFRDSYMKSNTYTNQSLRTPCLLTPQYNEYDPPQAVNGYPQYQPYQGLDSGYCSREDQNSKQMDLKTDFDNVSQTITHEQVATEDCLGPTCIDTNHRVTDEPPSFPRNALHSGGNPANSVEDDGHPREVEMSYIFPPQPSSFFVDEFNRSSNQSSIDLNKPETIDSEQVHEPRDEQPSSRIRIKSIEIVKPPRNLKRSLPFSPETRLSSPKKANRNSSAPPTVSDTSQVIKKYSRIKSVKDTAPSQNLKRPRTHKSSCLLGERSEPPSKKVKKNNSSSPKVDSFSPNLSVSNPAQLNTSTRDKNLTLSNDCDKLKRDHVSQATESTEPQRRDSSSGPDTRNESSESSAASAESDGTDSNDQNPSGQSGQGREEIIRARVVDPDGCGDDCPYKCMSRVKLSDRQYSHGTYWGTGNKKEQWECLNEWIEYAPENSLWDTEYDSDGGSRQKKNHYFLPKADGDRVRVCKKMFLKTLDISDQQIRTARKKKLRCGPTGVIQDDRRGKHTNRIVVSEAAKDSARRHIESFPTMESHYCRENTEKLYLDENVDSIAHMCRLYKENAEEEGLTDIVSDHMYADIFNNEYNYAFFVPMRDRCEKCVAYENSTESEKKQIKKNFDDHQANKKMARKLMAEADELSRKNPSVGTYHFDLEKTFALPCAQVGIFYYLSKINIWILTIYRFSDKKGVCCVWNQTIGNRGSNEIASFVYDYMKLEAQSGKTLAILHSDNCGGQNRNRNVITMIYKAAIDFHMKFIHRFLEVGHTQSAGDSIHATIERAVRNKPILTQQQLCDYMRNAKTTNPYEVVEKSQDDIYDFTGLAELFNWSLIEIASLREYSVDPSQPGLLFYKYDLRDPEESANILLPRVTNKRIANWKLVRAYKERLPISEKKRSDMNKIVEKRFVESQYRPFYQEILENASVVPNKKKEKNR
ncbi:hypothetical protein QAD02_002385 [Eretmocerus hayati]|uniref:Uncharacterized protein n=1 Tax=Eretmocerus hayati TaxID=131215 RepID=A0ACC2NKH1_9HYME|nr:hypothetical protein QAD02_002385 [Eretmocerus hayati]